MKGASFPELDKKYTDGLGSMCRNFGLRFTLRVQGHE